MINFNIPPFTGKEMEYIRQCVEAQKICGDGSFTKKLFSLYLTYLPKEKFKYAMKMNCDDRGSFTELVHTTDCGQVSINISKPGITKGQHWHNSKWEQFIVVHGHGLRHDWREGHRLNGLNIARCHRDTLLIGSLNIFQLFRRRLVRSNSLLLL